MMNRTFILLLLLVQNTVLQAQWLPIGNFNRAPSCIWKDTIQDRLLVAGQYFLHDSNLISGFGYLLGDSVVSVGCGFGVPCGATISPNTFLPVVKDFERFNGDLYVTGFFELAGGEYTHGIAKWDHQDWKAIGRGLRYEDGSTGQGHGLHVIGGELYVFGSFDSLNGVAANSIAKYDGMSWQNVHNFPRFTYNSQYPNLILDIESYQGRLVVGGTFRDGTHNCLVEWTGTTWLQIGSGYSGFSIGVEELQTYQEKLFVGGYFNWLQSPGGNPGNGVAAWDGLTWDTLSGGVWHPQGGGGVSQLMIWNDQLVVGGIFQSAGGLPASNLAVFDGSQWCGIMEPNQFQIAAACTVGDSLWLSFNSGGIGTVPAEYHAAKAYLGNFCQTSAINQSETTAPALTLHPNPTQSHFSISGIPPSGATLSLHDLSGRMLMAPNAVQDGQQVDVGHLPAGIYVVTLRGRDWQKVMKVVRE